MGKRADEALALFMEGFSCAQSVFAAFADLYDIDRDTALKLSSSFGAGIGRMRETCGAFSALAMITGLETGCTDPTDAQGKADNYAKVQELAARFREFNGSLSCRELLQLTEEEKQAQTHVPDERNEQYYASRPCARIVFRAALIGEEAFCQSKERPADS
ncbi:MAG: C-GCAxxG-C-C family protein [Lachnospiraceae bacterium]|nr:C-GCAxxG-C-C family protein [Lachnospiraceae bacterium]